MRLLILLIILSTPIRILACDKPYVLQVGPEFSSNFIIGYLGSFTLGIAQNVGCGTRLKGADNYTEFLHAALDRTAEIFLVPEHFAPALVKEGFIVVLQRKSTTKLLFISSLQSKPDEVQVLTPSEYSVDYYLINEWIFERGLKNINHDFGQTYASVVMKTIKNPNVVASIPDQIFNRIPQGLQDKVAIYDSGAKLGAYIMISDKSPKDLIPAIKQSIEFLHSEDWDANPIITPSASSLRFEKNLEAFKKSKK